MKKRLRKKLGVEEFADTAVHRELAGLLAAAFPDPAARAQWLKQPSGILGGLIPAELISARRAARVCQALASLEDGVFT